MRKCILILTMLLVLMIGLSSCTANGKPEQQTKVKLEENQGSDKQAKVRLEGTPGIGEGDQSNPGNIIKIKDYSFQPPTLTVPAGTIVTWHNEGGMEHTVTSDTPGIFDSGQIGPGKKFSFTFSVPGSYPYHCSIHTDMQGVIAVTGSTPAAVALVANVSTSKISEVITPEQIISGPIVSGTTLQHGKSSASWSEKPLIGQNQTQVVMPQDLTLQLNLNQAVGQKQVQAPTPQGKALQASNQEVSQVVQFSQYYEVTPQAPSKPLTAPIKYELRGQEPTSLYFGASQKAVPYSQYQSLIQNAGLNSLWIQGASSWTEYAMVPQGASLSMIATAFSGGNGYLYEVYPDGTLDKNGYYFYPYNQIGFYADAVGQHLLYFVTNSQPSNIVVIDVVPYQPPPPIYNYAGVTISSNWLSGYDAYVDGTYQATAGMGGQPPGMVSFNVPGDQYHTIAVYGDGFQFSDYRYFNSGWGYSLNI